MTNAFKPVRVSVMHEVAFALRALVERGEESAIDLGALPLTETDINHIVAALGRGEVRVTLDAMGESAIWETEYPGIWIVEHRDASGVVRGKLINITYCPAILRTHEEDAARGLDRLNDQLEADVEKLEYRHG